MEYIFELYKPDIVFHAAAYKHVPLMEKNPYEAVSTNVYGTKVVSDLAVKYEVEKFVMISTDKAVNPTNTLGATKRIAEIYTEILNKKSKTRFLTVRFGNVLDSEGSVVPLFREQIKKGGPITVTDREIVRYFMTIPESCQLILQASTLGRGGEIFILDMGEPVYINYLAEQMIKLSGFIPNIDINIEYIGLRPGEKMHEELFYDNESRVETAHSKILLAKHPLVNIESMNTKISEIVNSIEKFDDHYFKELIKEIVPLNDEINSNVISFNQKKYE